MLKTANWAWKALEDSYGRSNDQIKSARLQNTRRLFESIKMMEEEEVEDFYMRVKDVINKMAINVEKMDDAIICRNWGYFFPSFTNSQRCLSTPKTWPNLSLMDFKEFSCHMKWAWRMNSPWTKPLPPRQVSPRRKLFLVPSANKNPRKWSQWHLTETCIMSKGNRKSKKKNLLCHYW